MRLLADSTAAIVLWAMSLPVIGFIFGMLSKLSREPFPGSLSQALLAVAVVCGCFAWLLLLAMTVAWLARRKLPSVVPYVGHVLGAIGLTPFLVSSYGLALVFVLPGILLVIVVTRFHTSTNLAVRAQVSE